MTIAENNKQFGINVFSNCSGLKKVSFADGVKEISSSLFVNCGEIREVILPKSVGTIEEKTFDGTKVHLICYYGTDSEFERIIGISQNISYDNVVCNCETKTYTVTDVSDLNASVEVRNISSDAYAVVAVYNADGKLMQIKKDIINSTRCNTELVFDKPIENSQIIKTFIWESINSIKPLTKCEIQMYTEGI